MKKETLMQLATLLPGKDAQIAKRLLQQRKYENLKEIVDTDIRKFELEEDQTGEIEKRLAGLYRLSDGLNDYIVTFDDIDDYEEI